MKKSVRIQTSHGHVRGGALPEGGHTGTALFKNSRRKKHRRKPVDKATKDGKRTLSSSWGPSSSVVVTKDAKSKSDLATIEFAHQQLQDKSDICVDILCNGYVQSFVDFFYLTHRPSVSSSSSSAKPEVSVQSNVLHSRRHGDEAVSVEHMQLIKSNLTRAEDARRRAGEVDEVYKCYNNLARHFLVQKDHQTCVYFYEKCLEIANMTLDREGEMKANHNLGLAYESAGNFERAIRCHENHADISKSLKHKDEEIEATKHLMRALVSSAEQLTAKQKYKEALSRLEYSLRAAIQTACEDSIARAHYRVGCAQLDVSEYGKAKEYLLKYLDMIRDTGDQSGMGEAHLALALVYRATKESDEAVKSLQDYLSSAKRTGNLDAQAEACFRLGSIFEEKQLHGRAVEYFSQNYGVVQTMVSKSQASLKRLNVARIRLGRAKGNLSFSNLFRAVQCKGDAGIGDLLKWKNSRSGI